MRHEALLFPPIRRARRYLCLFSSVLLGTLLGLTPLPSEGISTTRVLPSGDGIELVVEGPHGRYSDILPLHQVNEVPYFSAGVGQEEREATYPPYSLKLEFLTKDGAFTGLVDLMFKPELGQGEYRIPKEHAKGPWLFINLPPGVYSVTGVRQEGAQTKSGIEVVSGLVTTVQLIWDE